MVPIAARNPGRKVLYCCNLLPLLAVIMYTVFRHAGYGFDKQAGHWVMDPFFKDHTSYGAVLAMFWFPALALFLKPERSAIGKLSIGATLVVLSVGLILSFTRAAWVSVAASAALAP